jgi:sortase (surface protein transpeptidase)
MNSLTFNFIKRAFIIPIAVTLVVVLGMFIFIPTSSSAQSTTTSVSKIDLSGYSLAQYSKFKQLDISAYVGSISSDSLGINCAITYSLDSENINTVLLSENSTEPWNDGSVVLLGDDNTSEFKTLHDSVIGDEITIDFYSNNKYTYKINDVSYGKTLKDIKSYNKKNTLVMYVPYSNFDDLSNSYYYVEYVAELV